MVLKMPNGDDADKKPAKGGKRLRKRIANELELQRSYRVCAEGTQESILWRKAAEVGKIPRTLCNWKKIRKIEVEACPNHVQMLAEVPGMEMQASKQGIWWVLRGFSGKESEKDRRMHPTPTGRRQGRRTTGDVKFRKSAFTGCKQQNVIAFGW